MQWMIEKKDRQKVALLEYLMQRPELRLSIKMVQEAFDWSKYIALTTIRDLVADLATFYPDLEPFVTLSDDEKTLILNRERNYDATMFRLNYLRESIPWLLMKELFDETMHSYDDFAVRNLTTVSTTRNAKLELDDYFAGHGVVITPDYTLAGNESEVRSMYFRIFQLYFADRAFPFENSDEQLINRILDEVTRYIKPDDERLRETKRIAIRFTIAIWLGRLQHGHVISNDDVDAFLLPNDQLNERTRQLTAYVEQLVMQLFPTLTAEDAHREGRYVVMGFFSIGVGVEMNRRENMTPLFMNMLAAFIQIVDTHYNKLFNAHLTALEQDAFFEVFFELMVAAVTSPTPDEGRNRVRLDAAYEQFPLMAELALAVIDDVAERRHLDITLARGAFFEVLYTGFASIFDMHQVFPKIKVALDINYQIGLESILTDMILGMRAMNIEISEYIDDDTDILISDINNSNIPAENTFIWTSMPTSLEFEQLRRRMNIVKADKFEKIHGIKLRYEAR